VNIKPFTGPGSTPARRQFWEAARLIILSARKVAGHHVTVAEYPGKGTVINVDERRRGVTPGPGTGACCISGSCGITTPDACALAGGDYFGDGSTCETVSCVQCDGTPSGIAGTVVLNYSASDPDPPNHSRTTSIPGGTFAGSTLSSFLLVGGAYTDSCSDGSNDNGNNRHIEVDVTCSYLNPNPADDGWYIHLFIGLASFCVADTNRSFGTTSAFDSLYQKYAPSTSDGTGSFSIELTFDPSGAGGFGSGTCHVDFTIS
jgi:hypothetical protein